jgi:hypothetical protein
MAGINTIKERKPQPFVVKLFLFLIILYILDFSIGCMLKYLYHKQNSGLLYRTTYAIDSTKADILIFGSSTANHNYYPDTFEKKLQMSCYNTGRDGEIIFYNYAILKGILNRYSPKIAILDFNRDEFKKDQSSYDRLSSLLPYYDTNPGIDSIIELKSPYEKYKLFSKIYPYNSLIFTIAAGNANFNKSRENDQEGYVPLTKIWNRKIITDTSIEKYQLDSTKIKIFKSFIRNCVDSNIRLYIIMSPQFMKYEFEDPSVLIGQEIAKKFNIPFFNFSNDTEFLNDVSLFTDIGHLNDRGAKIYTNRVIDKIIQDQQNESTLFKNSNYSIIKKK